MKKKKEHIVNVQPIRTAEDIEKFKLALERGNKGTPKRKELADRDVLLFLVGINTGLRVSDIVTIKVGDVKGKDQAFIREQKTDKVRELNLKPIRREIDSYTKDKPESDYLFKSQKGKHISTTQAYRILQDAGDFLGWDFIGTHTMRKTFGYHHYKRFRDVAILQEIFNHSAPHITRTYIGIRQDEINATLDDFRLG